MKKANDKSKSPYLKQIILSSCCAVLSLVVLAVATAAWFARNDRVKATNVNIKVDPEANLVISKNPVDPRDRQWLPEVTYEEESTAILTPISHDKDGGGTRLSTLHYCKLPSKIGRDTGYKIDNTTPDKDVFGAVTDATEGTRTFYKDVYVLIASENKAFTHQTLTATMYLADEHGDRLSGFDNQFNATSVDFYVCSYDANGTAIVLPEYDFNKTLTIKQTAADPGASVTLFTDGEIPVIPETTGTPIPVLMRFYFDGALSDDAEGSPAYVRTSNVSLADINITVEFTTADTTS